MLTFYFIVWSGIPPNSSYCCFAHATQCLLTNDPNYDMQQSPLTQIQQLYNFLRVGMIMLFIAFNPSTTKEKKKIFHRESTTYTRHGICRGIPRGPFTARIMVTYKYLVQGVDLFIPFITAFFYIEVQGV